MCGATGAQQQLQEEEMQTYQDYDNMMKQQYANQTALYSKVTSVLQPIFEKGPSQEGMSAAEKANLDAQAIEGTAENYRAAEAATSEQLAAEGGGNIPITTGAEEQLKGNVALSAAQEESRQETQIEAEDYTLGRENFQNAEGGLMAVAGGENPLGYMGAVTSAGNTANTEAENIAQEDNSWINAAIGAAGAIGGGALKGAGL